jgi:hypothetical protein
MSLSAYEQRAKFPDADQGGAMIPEDSTYYAKRSAAELEQAQRAATAKAAQLHHELAKAYAERATSGAPLSGEEGS